MYLEAFCLQATAMLKMLVKVRTKPSLASGTFGLICAGYGDDRIMQIQLTHII